MYKARLTNANRYLILSLCVLCSSSHRYPRIFTLVRAQISEKAISNQSDFIFGNKYVLPKLEWTGYSIPDGWTVDSGNDFNQCNSRLWATLVDYDNVPIKSHFYRNTLFPLLVDSLGAVRVCTGARVATCELEMTLHVRFYDPNLM